MGSGTWTTSSFSSYASSRGYSVTATGAISGDFSAQEMYKQKGCAPELNPYNVVRECRDSEEHPETVPVILALDVTGSMGKSAVEVAKKLNVIMTDLYERVKDVEFMIMAIGDLAYDSAPIQASQFESDIRIAEQLDKVYFESGGGGNAYESYTAAWYFGLHNTDLDCWKRGKKGILITLGDEPLNPYLPVSILRQRLGNSVTPQSDIETQSLYKEASEKFDIYHIAVNDVNNSYKYYGPNIERSFGKYLDKKHLLVSTINSLANDIVNIVTNSDSECSPTCSSDGTTESEYISW